MTHCPDDHTPLVYARDFADAAGDPMLGRILNGRYNILARLGAGSMGTVYRARQEPIGREVAIKILRSDRAVDEASKGRFLREARANSVLSSPNTVTVYDFGTSDAGELYLVMELLEGESLGQRIKRAGRLSVEASIHMAKQALASLAEAHAKGIVHRDLKPDNLFFATAIVQGEKQEKVKVVDFGIAKMLGDQGMQLNAVETQAGTVFGTPRYMSPEQAQGKPLDSRSDLYSLGVILYHCLTGRPPFTDDDAIVVMARHIRTQPKLLSEACPEAKIPPSVESVILRALAKEPEDRPGSAEQFARELDAALDAARPNTSGIRQALSLEALRQHAQSTAPREPLSGRLPEPPLPPRWVAPLPSHPPPPNRILTWLVAIGAGTLAGGTLLVFVLAYRAARAQELPPTPPTEFFQHTKEEASSNEAPSNLPTVAASALPLVSPPSVTSPSSPLQVPRVAPRASEPSVPSAQAAPPPQPSPTPRPAVQPTQPEPPPTNRYEHFD